MERTPLPNPLPASRGEGIGGSRAGPPRMTRPVVSICIPTYHRRELLSRALRSCLAQTYQDFEIIITDNSSDDDSEELVAALKEPRIRYHRNEANLGGIGNVARVATLASGKYLKLLMDDDMLKPRALEAMVDAFESHPTVGIVMAPMDLVDEEDRRIFPWFYVVRKMHYRYRYQVGNGLVPGRTALREFLVHDYPCCVPSGVLYRTDCFQKLGFFDPRCDFAIDLEMAMRIAAHYDFFYIDEVLSSWRCMAASHTSALHAQGFNIGAFYYITRKALADPAVIKLFEPRERERLVRDSLFFCAGRAMLNCLAGLRARRWEIIARTLGLIRREDPFLWNKLRLPWFIVRQVLISFVPPRKPLPKE